MNNFHMYAVYRMKLWALGDAVLSPPPFCSTQTLCLGCSPAIIWTHHEVPSICSVGLQMQHFPSLCYTENSFFRGFLGEEVHHIMFSASSSSFAVFGWFLPPAGNVLGLLMHAGGRAEPRWGGLWGRQVQQGLLSPNCSNYSTLLGFFLCLQAGLLFPWQISGGKSSFLCTTELQKLYMCIYIHIFK